MLAGNLATGYTPNARPLGDDPLFWDKAREKGLGDWLELDLYDVVRTNVENFITKGDSTVWQILRHTATWGELAQHLRFFVANIWPHLADGRQAVYDQVIDELKKVALEPEVMFQLLHNTVDILGGHGANLKLSSSIEIGKLARSILKK